MRFHHNIPCRYPQSGIMLVECMVYLAVLVILISIAIGVFNVCWRGFSSMISTAGDVSAALRAGERWRADVRGASGTINVEMTPSGQVVKIPENGTQIIYSFDSGKLRRQVGANGLSLSLLPMVTSSEMKQEMRGPVTAWQWELELPESQHGPHLPMLFTFEAAQRAQ